MSEPTKRHVEANFFENEHALYWKARDKWNKLAWAGILICLLAYVLFKLPKYFDLPSFLTPLSVVIAALSFVVWVGSKIKCHQIKRRDLSLHMAEQYLSAAGVADPKEDLRNEPRLFEAFKEVQTAVSAQEASNRGVAITFHEDTPLSYRIASLVLRDEESLARTPQLIALIKDQGILDYDALAESIDS